MDVKVSGRIIWYAPGLLWALAFGATAQEPQDGVLRSCAAQGNANDVCICASVMLHTRLGDQQYARFSQISNRIADIGAGAAESDGEMAALTAEGFRYFLPHGQAISVCRQKIAARP